METLIKQQGRIITLTLNIDADAFAEAVGLKSHTNGTSTTSAGPARKAAKKTNVKAQPLKAPTKAPAKKAPAKRAAKTVSVPIDQSTTPAKRAYNKLTDDVRARIAKIQKADPDITHSRLADELDVPYHTVVGWLRTLRNNGTIS